LGEKVYISEILNWLNKTNYNLFKPKNNFIDNDSFYLNNEKLLNKIKVKVKKSDLKKYCKDFR
jgi:hypothetical protein